MGLFDTDGIGWKIFIVILLELLTMFMLASPESALKIREAEHRSTAAMLTDERARRAANFANKHFNAHFVETGIVRNVQAALVPTDEQRARATGLENFVPKLFAWVGDRLQGFWSMLYSAYHRLYVMGFMMVFAAPLVIPALGDAVGERRISIELHDVATPVFFHGAKKVLIVMVLMPLFVLFLPFTVKPAIWFLWLLLLPAAIWVTAKNVQEL